MRLHGLASFCLLLATASGATVPFEVPTIPIDNRKAAYPQCKLELMLVLDVSGSITGDNRQVSKNFLAEFVKEISKNVQLLRFGIVLFGLRTDTQQNGMGVGTLAYLGVLGEKFVKDAFDGEILIPSVYTTKPTTFNQLQWLADFPTDQKFGGQTPTSEALGLALEQFRANEDVGGLNQFLVLITDGEPTDNPDPTCRDSGQANDRCTREANERALVKAENAVKLVKTKRPLMITIGVNLTRETQKTLTEWASEPKELLARPNMTFEQLNDLVPQLLKLFCPRVIGEAQCVSDKETFYTLRGDFLETKGDKLKCKFKYKGGSADDVIITKGEWFGVNGTDPKKNITLTAADIEAGIRSEIRCYFPSEQYPGIQKGETIKQMYTGEYLVDYTLDGLAYQKGRGFKYGTVCGMELVFIPWPFMALILLPLAFLRKAKPLPPAAPPVARGTARAAPAVTEEYEEYEEVEQVVEAKPEVNKWKVAPTAYIGFGRARMSVDWAGAAPESAPHEGVRKKVVVRKQVPAGGGGPGAGGAVPMAAVPADNETGGGGGGHQEFVEEPDWIDGILDGLVKACCCCCSGSNKQRV